MNLSKNPAVKELARVMDLDLPKYYLVITDYHFEAGAISINKIKLFDSKGVFIRFVDNKKVVEHMNKYPVAFEKLEV